MPDIPDRVKKRLVHIPKPAEGPYWHSRGYLPHHENWEKIQVVTFRLAGALPRQVLERLANESQTTEGDAAYFRRLETYLDAGHGECWLRLPQAATIVKNAFLFYENKRYGLHAWVIMPNHVHFIIELIEPYTLSKVIKDWKSFTSKEINRFLNRSGQLWQEEYWDRFIRNKVHYEKAVDYVLNNPLKAGLVECANDWPWSGCKDISSNPQSEILP